MSVRSTRQWCVLLLTASFKLTLVQFERKIQRDVLSTYASQGQVLPPNHPLTRHVRRVASRIISSSHLGTVSGDGPAPQLLVFPNGEDMDVWNPDVKIEADKPGGFSGRQWEVIVIDDKRMVNAFAVPGERFRPSCYRRECKSF